MCLFTSFITSCSKKHSSHRNNMNNLISGCIKDVRLNGKLLDFMNARKQQRVAPGCSDLEDPKPCKEHLCQKGKCVPLDKSSYECQCRKGWSGEHCDQGMHFLWI